MSQVVCAVYTSPLRQYGTVLLHSCSSVFPALEKGFKNTNLGEAGILGEILNKLRFADTVIIIAGSIDDLERKGEEFANQSEEVGLQMSGKGAVTLSRGPKSTIIIKDAEKAEPNEMMYLVQIIF